MSFLRSHYTEDPPLKFAEDKHIIRHMCKQIHDRNGKLPLPVTSTKDKTEMMSAEINNMDDGIELQQSRQAI